MLVMNFPAYAGFMFLSFFSFKSENLLKINSNALISFGFNPIPSESNKSSSLIGIPSYFFTVISSSSWIPS